MGEKLKLLSVVGFGGLVHDGLVHHPDGDRIVYALGSTIVVRSKESIGNQQFLQGHSDKVSIGQKNSIQKVCALLSISC